MQDGQHGQGISSEGAPPLPTAIAEVRDGGRLLLALTLDISSVLPKECPHCGASLVTLSDPGHHTMEATYDIVPYRDLEPLSNGQDVPGDALRQEK